ncbi:von Willebrand factor C domain-containing protein 2-like [Haliotis rubra]|uniref:von Willebrand factor C domain-containing protein 2-like n=1 Tax=Haliotis rubra TaxID=36100 RepID=UPI001EE60C82|nr:von Willebrand factor C domain-containing protein 2-like [Haliotis rubra]
MMAIRLAACTLLLGLFSLIIEGAVISHENGCVVNGVTYKEGERVNKNPCSPCTCSQGRMMCMAIDCAPPMCVNPVQKPNHCCGTCPDGNNCKYKDVVIKSGDTYHPDTNTVCSCSTDFSYLFGPHGHEALCVHKATGVTGSM